MIKKCLMETKNAFKLIELRFFIQNKTSLDLISVLKLKKISLTIRPAIFVGRVANYSGLGN